MARRIPRHKARRPGRSGHGARLPAHEREDRAKSRFVLWRLCAQRAGARRHRHDARRYALSRRAETRRDLSDRTAHRLSGGERRDDAGDVQGARCRARPEAGDQLCRRRLRVAARGRRRAAGHDDQPRPGQAPARAGQRPQSRAEHQCREADDELRHRRCRRGHQPEWQPSLERRDDNYRAAQPPGRHRDPAQ